jgi:hypothetical protein
VDSELSRPLADHAGAGGSGQAESIVNTALPPELERAQWLTPWAADLRYDQPSPLIATAPWPPLEAPCDGPPTTSGGVRPSD